MKKWWILGALIILAVIAIWLLRADESPRALTASDAINMSGQLNRTDRIR